MPTYDLGTATVSTRVAQLVKESYERAMLPLGQTATAEQILDWIREEIRSRIAQRVMAERKRQRNATADDDALDAEVTIDD